MSVETNGSDYLIVESSTTLIAGTDFPVDRTLVFDAVGGGGGGNSGGSGYAWNYTQDGVWHVDAYLGLSGLGGSNGEHRTYTFAKNTFTIGDVLTIVIGTGGNGALKLGIAPPQYQGYPASYESIKQYASGARGTNGTDTIFYKNGQLLIEASGGESKPISIQDRWKGDINVFIHQWASNGYAGWSSAIPFKVANKELYAGGIGGTGGKADNPTIFATDGASGGFGAGGGGGGGGAMILYAGLSVGKSGGNGGAGGRGFASIRWGEFGAESVNKEVFQPSFFTYSPDIE